MPIELSESSPTSPPRPSLASVYLNRTMAALTLLGFGSGLPLALTSDTIQAWLRSKQYDLETVGFITLVGLPYSFQVVWAPIVDRFAPRLGALGRRRAWLLLTQVGLIAAIAAMAVFGPETPGASLWLLAGSAVAVAFVSATQDIASNAYRTDVLPDAERGAGAAVFVTGYRLAMIATGAGVLALSAFVSWRWAYLAAAGAMAIGLVGTALAPEPKDTHAAPSTVREAVVEPLRSFLGRPAGWLILAFVLVFKLPDYLAGRMTMPFLLDLKYSTLDIASIRQTFGLWITIVGTLVGGAVVAKAGLMRSLILFGVLQAVSNAGFLVLANAEPTRTLLVGVITVESFCGGLVTAGFVAFLMSCCERRYSATQYALLVSMMTLGSILAGSITGVMAQRLGYSSFFAFTILAAVPGMAMLPFAARAVTRREA